MRSIALAVLLGALPPALLRAEPKEEEWLRLRRIPYPHLPTGPAIVRSRGSGAATASQRSAGYDPELEALAHRMTDALSDRFGEAVRRRDSIAFRCDRPKLAALRLRALVTLGDYRECVAMAEGCLANLPSNPELGAVVYQGARCASAGYDSGRAWTLLDQATRPDQSTAADFTGRIYGFARWAYFTQYQEWAKAILARNPEWAGSEDVVLGIMEYLSNGVTKKATPAAIESEVQRWLRGNDPLLREVATLGWSGHLAYNRYRFREALRMLDGSLVNLISPQSWFPLTYISLYRQPTPNYELALHPYDAALPVLHPAAWLPTQYNPYTYTQIAQTICLGHVTEGRLTDELHRLQSGWLSGVISTDDALAQAERLDRSRPGQADILTWMGSLHEVRGDDRTATIFYWWAHRACPYYNRSHDGLDIVDLRAYRRSFADWEARRTAAETAAQSTSFPLELTQYVRNWPTLSSEGQDRFKYAARYWANHIRFLFDGGLRLYVKHAYQLISDVPGFEGLRDTRVSYPDDNRLWDDVGGVSGGDLAVVAYSDVLDAPFSGYDVVAHEMAHQFHGRLPARLRACVQALYQGALGRNLFADPYSAVNEWEYFAQGVALYLVPADSPPRFGLTVTWLIDNDPALYRILRDIERVRSADELQCPVGPAN